MRAPETEKPALTQKSKLRKSKTSEAFTWGYESRWTGTTYGRTLRVEDTSQPGGDKTSIKEGHENNSCSGKRKKEENRSSTDEMVTLDTNRKRMIHMC